MPDFKLAPLLAKNPSSGRLLPTNPLVSHTQSHHGFLLDTSAHIITTVTGNSSARCVSFPWK